MNRAAKKPGWGMSQRQHDLFWRLWRNACTCQKWDVLPVSEREQKRRETLVACGFKSATHIDGKSGFDTVKKRLLELCDRVRNEPADAGHRRRVLARIGEALAELDQAGYRQRSIETILRIRFKVLPGIRTLPELETEELVNLSRTLSARLASWTQWQALAGALRSILIRMAMCKPWPAVQATPASVDSTPPESPVHTIFRTHAAELLDTDPAPFFIGT